MFPSPRPVTGGSTDPVIGPGAPPSGPGRRIGLTPISLLLVLLIAYLLVKVQFVIFLTLLALLFATVIERPVEALHARRIPRGLSILIVYVLIIGGFVLLSLLIVPPIAEEIRIFTAEAPADLRSLQATWSTSSNPILSGVGRDALSRAIDLIEDPAAPPQEAITAFAINFVGGVVGLLTGLVIAFYYLLEKQLLRRLILGQITSDAARNRVGRVWDDVEGQLGRWLRGQLTLVLVIGVTASIGYGLMGIRFWPLLGIVAGLTEFIPIVGPWLGGIPAVIIALTQGWEKAILATVFLMMLQLLENTILVPRIMRGAVGLTPLTVFVAILAGTEFRGIAGAILAIPIAAIVQVIVTDALRVRNINHGTGRNQQFSSWRWMRANAPGTELSPTPTPPRPDIPSPADQD